MRMTANASISIQADLHPCIHSLRKVGICVWGFVSLILLLLFSVLFLVDIVAMQCAAMHCIAVENNPRLISLSFGYVSPCVRACVHRIYMLESHCESMILQH